MNPLQAHAVLSGAASRALLNEADRFAAIQARDTLAEFINQHLPGSPSVKEEVATPHSNGNARTESGLPGNANDLDRQLSRRTSTAPRK